LTAVNIVIDNCRYTCWDMSTSLPTVVNRILYLYNNT